MVLGGGVVGVAVVAVGDTVGLEVDADGDVADAVGDFVAEAARCSAAALVRPRYRR